MNLPVGFACLADTHGQSLLDCFPSDIGNTVDAIVLAGDIFPDFRNIWEYVRFWNITLVPQIEQLTRLVRYVIYVPGNHDRIFDREYEVFHRNLDMPSNLSILIDSYLMLDGVRIFGSPWVCPSPARTWAFERDERWQAMNLSDKGHLYDGVDLLITHSPPKGVLDRASDGESIGSQALWDYVHKVKPQAHVFGHCHESPGYEATNTVNFCNATLTPDRKFEKIFISPRTSDYGRQSNF